MNEFRRHLRDTLAVRMVLLSSLLLIAFVAHATPRPSMRDFMRPVASPTQGAGEYTTVAMDAAGRAHVAWYDATTGSLRYAWQVPGGWRSETIETGEQGPAGWYASLVMDARGVAHVAYYDAAQGVLKHAERRGGAWQVEVVDGAEGSGHYCALALTPNGAPAVSYYDATNLCLRYAEKTADGWRLETVDGAGNAAEAMAVQAPVDRAAKTPEVSQDVPNVGAYTSLAIARDGTVHISYQDVTGADLKVAVRRSGQWTSETVDAQGDVGEHTSLKLDGHGLARVGYYDLQHGTLKLASEGANGNWSVETVDASGDVGAYASLAIDSDGRERVSYLDAAKGALRYAERVDGGGWLTQQVDGEGEAGRNSSLALDGDGAPVIAYTARGAGAARPSFRLVTASVQSAGRTGGDVVAAGRPLAAWPLPYRGGALNVSFSLPAGAGEPEISLVDVAGRHVRALSGGQRSGAYRVLSWDGRDDAGRDVPDGVYFLITRAGGQESRLKLVVLR